MEAKLTELCSIDGLCSIDHCLKRGIGVCRHRSVIRYLLVSTLCGFLSFLLVSSYVYMIYVYMLYANVQMYFPSALLFSTE